MTRFLDLSHSIEDGMVTYKGLPAPVLCDYLSREASRSIAGYCDVWMERPIEKCLALLRHN